MRKMIVAGNWKMNTGLEEGTNLVSDLRTYLNDISLNPDKEVVIAPPFTHLASIRQVIRDTDIKLSAQNCSSEQNGAYTGEISATMLKEIGCTYVIIGHSERRMYYIENSEILVKKISRALENDLTPIYCCGELLEERNSGNQFKVVENQISEVLFNFSDSDFKKIQIAYEPVWAIGTGVTASKEQAQEMHAFIRNVLEKKFGKELSQAISILYGGSVKPENAGELFSQPDVDGGLVGGASLNAKGFFTIIQSA